MPAWPGTLPRMHYPRYELAPIEPILRTKMDHGNTRSRRRWSAFPTRIPALWRFSGAQMATFETFHKADLLDGQLAFDVELVNGDEISLQSAKFTGMWKAKLLPGSRWEVSAVLEVQSRPLLSAEQLEVGKAYPPEDIFYTTPRLHQLLHVDMPATYWWD